MSFNRIANESRTALYGKRKKKIPKCANPLFEKILTDLKNEADEKGWKSQFTYAKALKSLRKYPLSIPSGRDCIFLENFGDKICKLLDDKLPEYIAQQEAAEGQENDADDDTTDLPPLPSLPSLPNGSISQKRATSTSSSNADTSQGTPATKKRRSSSGSNRPYIPAYRSGPYAILLALYKELNSAHSKGYMTKAELIRSAQPLANKSFTLPDPGCRYTAWSSMGTLINKGLIIKESSPAKYSITAAGVDLAETLDSAAKSNTSQNASQLPNTPTHDVDDVSSHTNNFATTSSLESRLKTAKYSVTTYTEPHNHLTNGDGRIPQPHSHSSNGMTQLSIARADDDLEPKFLYQYINESDQKTRYKDQAKVSIDDDIGLGFLITCRYIDLLRAGKTYTIDVTRPLGDEYIFAYLKDDEADEIAPSVSNHSVVSLPQSTVTSTLQEQNSQSTSSSICSASTEIEQKKTKSRPRKPKAPTSNVQSVNTQSHSGQPLSTNQPPPMTSIPTKVRVTQRNIASTDRSVLGEPEFVLLPGSFQVILCVDNREFYGSSSSGGKQLLPGLIKNNLECDLRKLEAGDFVWVAKEISGDREVVLDHIIERKRMDDLVSSCVDGRLKEQKFRMIHSGLRRPMYLFEEYGSMKNFSISEDRLRQTITNIQIIDKFQVKKTSDTKESIAYFTVMTRYLQSQFKNKTIYAYKSEVLQEFPQTYDINSNEICLMTFEDFNQSTVKTKPLMVREMFGKQLVQMYRMSAESAYAILEIYPTPTHLMSAYSNCNSDKERETLLSTVKLGKSGRNLGVSLSRQMCQFYWTKTALT